MSNTIDNSQDVIDSRDVIARIEDLSAELEALTDAVSEAQEANDYHNSEGLTDAPEALDLEEAQKALDEWTEENGEELKALQALADEAESSPDWIYGESLIREDYFTEYTEELIKDCYEMPKEMDSGSWPYRHMTMDYEAAAEELKADYMEVDFDGVTYFIRA